MLLYIVAFMASLNSAQGMIGGEATVKYFVLPIILSHGNHTQYSPPVNETTTCIVIGESHLLTALRPGISFQKIGTIKLHYYDLELIFTLKDHQFILEIYSSSIIYIRLRQNIVELFARKTFVLKTVPLKEVGVDSEEEIEHNYHYVAFENGYIRREGSVENVDKSMCKDLTGKMLSNAHFCFCAPIHGFRPQRKDIGGAIIDSTTKLVAIIAIVKDGNRCFWAQSIAKFRDGLQELIDMNSPFPEIDSSEVAAVIEALSIE